MTIYEHCTFEADVCRTVARDPEITDRMRVSLIKQAETWEHRARTLSVTDGSRDVKAVNLETFFLPK